MEQQSIVNRLDKIEMVLRNMQENMNDVILTSGERKMLDESIEHEKSGKLISLETMKNVRNKTR